MGEGRVGEGREGEGRVGEREMERDEMHVGAPACPKRVGREMQPPRGCNVDGQMSMILWQVNMTAFRVRLESRWVD